ncbi:mandelate racemase/muconate lactonizing enzyme family protein [Paraburkholderia sp. Ac-20342]|uniref:mandelate racemase/muconate lactonizing enzyme family protein n=1 Tax=Paraburkholderia sp. Ac-20342 TaxID=2703889 RepID=UPI0019809816|nr:mandelate racemase/muconate lactonizing enzyme family protein [Paraburkholderia sp. Ac-20342]MBN3846237.1 mandelate racemase/muconate lactonizing enzyme family protein [Paraburkholderia sp. Ac-20342]
MKIASVTPIFADRFLYVKVTTEDGLTGIGESGAWGQYEASAAAMVKCGEYLVGRDARQIEHHWNVLQRANHFTGMAIMGAISAIDIALWDIKGKALGVPVYELIGGQMRHKVRLYGHVKARTKAEMLDEALLRKEQGFTALGHLNPFLDEDYDRYFRPHAKKMEEAVGVVRELREALGPDVDLCIELHRRLNPAEAVTFARRIEPYFPMFFEDPLKPTGVDAMSWVADHIPVPIATGERFFNMHLFQSIVARRGVQFLRPSIGLCGGITGAKKIAALAEVNDMEVVPHNPLSPLNLVAELHLDATIPNFAIQEYPSSSKNLHGTTQLPGREMFTDFPEPSSGFLDIPTAPGLGIDFVPDIEKRFPKVNRPLDMRPHLDGSVIEQ